MIQPMPPPSPTAMTMPNPATAMLEDALGARARKMEIIKKHMGYWDPPKPTQEKVFSPRPHEVDL